MDQREEWNVMYKLWKMDEEALSSIEKKVRDQISDNYGQDLLGLEYVLETSVESHVEDIHYEMGWMAFFPSTIVYLGNGWYKSGCPIEKLKIHERWTMDGITDHHDVKVMTVRGEKDVELVLVHGEVKRTLMSCSIKRFDQEEGDRLLSREKRQGDNLKDVEHRLRSMLEKML